MHIIIHVKQVGINGYKSNKKKRKKRAKMTTEIVTVCGIRQV